MGLGTYLGILLTTFFNFAKSVFSESFVAINFLLSATAGGNGGQVLKEIFKTLSSSAYDRTLEKEADIASVEYMLNANIDPKPFADFPAHSNDTYLAGETSLMALLAIFWAFCVSMRTFAKLFAARSIFI